MNLQSLNSLNLLSNYPDLILLSVRIFLGIVFIYYGRTKIKDLKQNAKEFESMGFKPDWLFGSPVAFLETFGSLLLVFGLFTSIIAAAFAIHMLVGTIWKVTKTDKPFTDWSYDFLLLCIALILMVYGAGSYAITI